MLLTEPNSSANMSDALALVCCIGTNSQVSVGKPEVSSIVQPFFSLVESYKIPRTPLVHLETEKTLVIFLMVMVDTMTKQ